MRIVLTCGDQVSAKITKNCLLTVFIASQSFASIKHDFPPEYPYFEEISSKRPVRKPQARDLLIAEDLRDLAQRQFDANWFMRDAGAAQQWLQKLDSVADFALARAIDDFLKDLRRSLQPAGAAVADQPPPLVAESSPNVRPRRSQSPEIDAVLDGFSKLAKSMGDGQTSFERAARGEVGAEASKTLNNSFVNRLMGEAVIYFYDSALYCLLGPGTSWGPSLLGRALASAFTITHQIGKLRASDRAKRELLRAIFYANPIMNGTNRQLADRYFEFVKTINSGEFAGALSEAHERLTTYKSLLTTPAMEKIKADILLLTEEATRLDATIQNIRASHEQQKKDLEDTKTVMWKRLKRRIVRWTAGGAAAGVGGVIVAAIAGATVTSGIGLVVAAAAVVAGAAGGAATGIYQGRKDVHEARGNISDEEMAVLIQTFSEQQAAAASRLRELSKELEKSHQDIWASALAALQKKYPRGLSPYQASESHADLGDIIFGINDTGSQVNCDVFVGESIDELGVEGEE